MLATTIAAPAMVAPTLEALPTPIAATTAPAAAATTPRSRQVPGFGRLRAVVRQSPRHGLWIVLWTLVGWVGTALAPLMGSHRLLLMLLAPRSLFVALASDSVSLVPFVLLGTMRLAVTDASYFIVGKRFPDQVGETPTITSGNKWQNIARAIGRKGDMLCRWFCARHRLAGAFLFIRPNGKYLAIAGAYGVPSWIAGACSAAGTATFLVAIHIGVGFIF